MNLAFKTNRGKVELKIHFPVSQKTKRHLRLAIENELAGESEFINADRLLKTLKDQDPTIGTPQGALLAYKHSRGWTQKTLSEKTGISQPDISKMLSNKRPIGLQAAKKLAKAFGVDYRRFV